MSESTFQLHPAQRDVFIDQLLNVHSPQYNIGGYIILKGALDKKKLHETINNSPAIFDVLKMRFDADAPDLVGYIDENYKVFNLPEIDLADDVNAHQTAKEWMQGRMNLAFTLSKTQCLFEQVLIRFSENEHWLFGRFHHLVMDGYGFIVWVQYMAKMYSALLLNEKISIQYPAYLPEAAIANDDRGKENHARSDHYWKERLTGKLVKLLTKKSGNIKTGENPTSTFTYNLDEELRERLENFARDCKASLQQATIAALLVYFGKISLPGNFVLGIPVHKRNSRRLRNIVGLFNGFLPFVGFYPKESTVLELVRSVTSSQSKDYRHQDFDIGNIIRHLQLNPAEENLWEVIVNYLPLNFELNFGKDINASIFRLVNEYERTPLQVCWNDYGKQQPLELQIHFSNEYFDGREIDLFVKRLLFILEQFTSNQSRTLEQVDILPAAEKAIIEGFSQSSTVPAEFAGKSPFIDSRLSVILQNGELAPVGVNGELCLAEKTVLGANPNLSDIFKSGQSARWTSSGSIEMAGNLMIEEDFLPAKILPVSIASSFVAEPLEEYVSYWSKEFELDVKVEFAPYNQLFQQLLDHDSLLHSGEGINVLLLRVGDWLRDQPGLLPEEQVEFLEKTYREFVSALESARKLSAKPYLLGVVPWILANDHSPLVIATIKSISQNIESFSGNLSLFYKLDLDKAAALYEVEEIFDVKSDELGHIPFTDECFAAIGTYITRRIRAWREIPYKVIALDCDNTLWNGICGEMGATNVIIDEPFKYLQKFFIERYKEGFLLVLCSKNNEEDVWEVFDKHPGMLLKREHIAAFKIDWQAKPGNLMEIASQLNLGIDSFIFLDDNDFEVEQMLNACPAALSIVLPAEQDSIPAFLDHIWAFDVFAVTDEDRNRNSMYKAEAKRKEEQVKFSSIKDFILTLDVQVKTRKLTGKDLERAVQLSLRTNQFNLNGIRKTQEEILGLIEDQTAVNWLIEVKDRFGDYGISGLILAREENDALVLNTFLLSCRVLGRNVEETVLAELVKYCRENELHTIKGMFQSSGKNKPFIEFLDRTNWKADPQANSYSFLINDSGEELLHTQ